MWRDKNSSPVKMISDFFPLYIYKEFILIRNKVRIMFGNERGFFRLEMFFKMVESGKVEARGIDIPSRTLNSNKHRN